VLIEACRRRGLNPLPFLLALACAANAGSAATLIGNPQNMLIGQTLNLSFGAYLVDAGIPAVLSLGAVWGIIQWRFAKDWHRAPVLIDAHAPPFNRWQTAKGFLVLAALLGVFLWSDMPREVAALSAAGLLLMSRRMASRDVLALVDWQLLVLFIGLFVVNHGLNATGALQLVFSGLRAAGIDLSNPAWLFCVTGVLSNLVSNVPAVMLLLPAASDPLAGPVLALASTLAGNLFLVGSIANIIVVDQAARLGVTVTWRDHARVGVPVTFVSLAIAAVWLWFLARL
jgi:Na+/H+ antiporter NhaD/arsenite permease-like protein